MSIATGPDLSGGREPPPRRPTEAERVLANVELRFLDLGFNPLQAAALADAGTDWHAAERLLDCGCSHETAVDILL